MIVVSNKYSFRTQFRKYVANITPYFEDDNDEKDHSKIRGNF
jgi:hypothetical protein